MKTNLVSSFPLRLFFGLALPLGATAASYTFATFPFPYPEGDYSQQVTSISNDGTVFGVYAIPPSNCCVSFAYRNGKFTDYFALPDGSSISDIFGSKGGQIIGGTFSSKIPLPFGPGSQEADFGFTLRNGAYTEIPAISKYVYFQPLGINDKGEMIGIVRDVATDKVTGAIYQNGQYTYLTDPGTTLVPTGINDSGEIIGVTYDNRDFIYKNGAVQFVTRPGATSLSFYGINDLGQIVGLSTEASGVTAFIRQPDGTYQDVPGPSWAPVFQPIDINDNGQILGLWGADCDPDSGICYNAGLVASPETATPEPATFSVVGILGFCALGVKLRKRASIATTVWRIE